MIAGLAAASAALPATAQSYYDDTPTVAEVVITPQHYGPDGRPDRLSRVVSLRDLDLTTLEGRRIMRLRVRDTARDICRALGESSGPSAGGLLTPSCVDQAVRDAQPQMRTAVNTAYRTQTYALLEPYPYPYYR
jgi:UrcA family protein